ncbi:MAG: anti-sigma regulatory factor (Ser/Thr protein kinase) [Acidimicrobiales bacterium]|jgi:anti-sigma regulatory factor (Ser/Thr protein kinase)
MSAPTVELDIPSRLDLVTVARMVVAAVASCVEALDGDRLDDLRWVTSEATTNAIQANLRALDDGNGIPGRVVIRVAATKDAVRLTVIDAGTGMSPAAQLLDITHPDRLEVEGGFGVPLMQMLSSSEVVFTSTPEGTTVELEVERQHEA